MNHRDRQALLDLLDAAAMAEALVRRGKSAYDADELLRLAAEAIVQRTGEAVRRLSDDFVAHHAEIASWRGMRGMRNLVVHEYQRIDHELLWQTLAGRLPGEAAAVRRLLGE